jgi:alanyl-tRNA synthetase
MTLQRQQKQRQLDDEEKQLTKQAQDITARKAAIQKEKAMLETRKSLKQRLKEASEVQQAQVVLASQDMVDQVQKMSEQISAMQFKDLPALVDQIKNEVGTDQAMQFNTDATAALAGLLQNLQGAKTQLEAALGVVTGQAPVVPGADMGAADAGLGGEMPAELPAPGEEEIDVTDIDVEEPAAAGLGRERR